MQKKYTLILGGFLSLGLLHGCNDSNDQEQTQNYTITDNNPNSCNQLASNGSTVVVGSGQAGDPSAPEPASAYRLGLKAKTSDQYMVVANTPLATKAGCDVLKAGGSAVDAAIAAGDANLLQEKIDGSCVRGCYRCPQAVLGPLPLPARPSINKIGVVTPSSTSSMSRSTSNCAVAVGVVNA